MSRRKGSPPCERAIPGLQTVKHDRYHPTASEPIDTWLRREQSALRQIHGLDNILVEALVSTYPIEPNGYAAHATVIQVYLGPQDLCGRSFVARYPFGPNGYDVMALNGRLAKEELVLTYLQHNADGTYVMGVSRLLPIGVAGLAGRRAPP